MSIDSEAFSSVIDDMYDSALDPALWQAVLNRVSSLTGSEGGVIYHLAPHRRAFLGRSRGGIDEAACDAYEQRHWCNPWAATMMLQPAGTIMLSDEILPFSELSRTGFHDEVLAPQRLGYSCMSPVISQPDHIMAFTICRDVRQGPMPEEGRTFVRALLPHLQRASQLQMRIENLEALQEASLAALDGIATGVVLVDRWARLVHVNRAAERVFRSGVLVSRDRTLHAATLAASSELRALILDVVRGGAGGAMALPSPGDVRLPIATLVAPSRGAMANRIADGLITGVSAAIFLKDPGDAPEPRADLLARLFRLTPAEARVAVALAQGEAFSVTARRLRIGVNTLKTHARRIFAKSGARRHAGFVRIVGKHNLEWHAPSD